MSTKITILSLGANGATATGVAGPGVHLWEDAMDTLDDSTPEDSPVYLQLERVEVKALATLKQGASLTVALPRALARQMGLLPSDRAAAGPRGRVTQGQIQRLLLATSQLIAAVHDARTRYLACQGVKPTQLTALARMLKELRALPAATTDYQPFESILKRRLVRAVLRVKGPEAHSLGNLLPSPAYDVELTTFEQQASLMLRRLADVPSTRTPLQAVAAVLARVPGGVQLQSSFRTRQENEAIRGEATAVPSMHISRK